METKKMQASRFERWAASFENWWGDAECRLDVGARWRKADEEAKSERFDLAQRLLWEAAEACRLRTVEELRDRVADRGMHPSAVALLLDLASTEEKLRMDERCHLAHLLLMAATEEVLWLHRKFLPMLGSVGPGSLDAELDRIRADLKNPRVPSPWSPAYSDLRKLAKTVVDGFAKACGRGLALQEDLRDPAAH
jgi:hypothetical protein